MPAARFVAEELKGYVDPYLQALTTFMAHAGELHEWEGGGTPIQKSVVAELWRFFPGGGRRREGRHSDPWCGYSFANETDEHYGWFGFVARQEFRDQDGLRSAEFIVHTDLEVEWAKRAYECVEPRMLCGPAWTRADPAWAIRFADDWVADDWRHVLAPLHRAVKEE